MAIAKVINARKLKGISQKDMAEKLGVSQPHYNKVENGEIQLRMDLIEKMCDVIEVPPFILLYNEDRDDWPYFDKESELTIEALKKKNELLEKENEQWKEIVELLKRNVELHKDSDLTKRNEQLWEIINHHKEEREKLEAELTKSKETNLAFNSQILKSTILNHKFRKKLIELGFKGVQEIESEVSTITLNREDPEQKSIVKSVMSTLGEKIYKLL